MYKLIDILVDLYYFIIPQFVSEAIIWGYDEDDDTYSRFICFIDEFEDGGEGSGIAKITLFTWLGFVYPIRIHSHIECPGIVYDGVTKNFKSYIQDCK